MNETNDANNPVGKPICQKLVGHDADVYSLHNTDPHRFISASEDGSCRIWDLRSQKNNTLTLEPNLGPLVSCTKLYNHNPHDIYVAGESCVALIDSRKGGDTISRYDDFGDDISHISP